jgi:hypothetical protein
VQNQALRGTSAWANNWLGRDHAAKHADKDSTHETKQPKAAGHELQERGQEIKELI